MVNGGCWLVAVVAGFPTSLNEVLQRSNASAAHDHSLIFENSMTESYHTSSVLSTITIYQLW